MIFIPGGTSGIGAALTRILRERGQSVREWGKPGSWQPGDPLTGPPVTLHDGSAIVVTAGSHDDPISDCLHITGFGFHRLIKESELPAPLVCIALSGGGVGGPPSIDLPWPYIAAKAGVVSIVEWFALKYPQHQFFAVAPGRTATKLTGFDGAPPEVPAAFIAELLTGKYGHLSGSLLAAQRDNLATVRPMKLRREMTEDEQLTWRGDPTP